MDRHSPLARSPPPLLLLLLLRVLLLLPPVLLLLPACVLGEAASGITVQVLGSVTGFLNESATLVCSLTSAHSVSVSQVTWTKNQGGSHKMVAVFHPTKGPRLTDPERMKFLDPRLDGDLWNASLAVSPLRVQDEGSYRCHIATYPNGSGSANTELRVLARPTNTAEAVMPSPSWKLQAVAKCISTGGRPASRISWVSDINGSVHKNQKLEPELGTFTVTSSFLLEPSRQADGMNITCQIEHESIQQADLRTVTLSVPYPPAVSISGYDDNWYVGSTNVTLTCNADSKPEPISYEWSTTEGPLPNTTEAQDNQLRIPIVDMDHINNITFICNVTNALGSGQNQVTVVVREAGQPSSTGQIIAIAVTVVVALAIVILIVYVLLRNRCGRRSKTSGGKYSSVNTSGPTQSIEMNGRS